MEKTHKYGLIGYPIAHSGSPVLFRKAYGGKWAYELIETPSFEEAWERFMAGYDAVNVTAPFKENAAARADILSPEVQSIGAANILVKTRCGVKAFNSDYLGVRMLLDEILEKKPRAADQRVVVVGYGGAGKAAAAAARDWGCDTIVCNRSDHGNPAIRPLSELPDIEADLVIYTLPMRIPEMEAYLQNARAGALKAPKALLEANYRDPVLSPESGCILPTGCRYIPGERWLLAQAVTGYEILTGEKPSF